MSDSSDWLPNIRQPSADATAADVEQNDLKDEEAHLISAVAQSHDREAFTKLFGRYAPKVKAFALRLGADSSAAEEVVQEVMIAVWRRAETFNPAKASVSTWIFTIARNKRYDHCRRAQRPMPDPNDPAFVTKDASTQDENIDSARLHNTVRSAVAALPLGTVKSRIRLALSKLRKAM